MMKIVGERAHQGAVFVYKDDGTESAAWADVEEMVHTSHGPIRGELHSNKQELLTGLKTWNEAVDPSNAHLCIYSHMGAPGIGCAPKNSSAIVTWLELQTALPLGVATLWLLGCNSQECLGYWNDLAKPVRNVLLATSGSKCWLPFLKRFAAEIDMENVRPYDEMPVYLARVEPELSKHIQYFRPSGNGFKKAF